MKTTLQKSAPGIIEWPESEPRKTTREEAIDTLRACAFLREDVRVFANGKWTHQRDIPRPFGLTDTQAIIAQEQLLHRIHWQLESFLPPGTPTKMIGPKDAPWDEGWMMEVGDGWSIGATIEYDRGYRGAIRWHVYDPEGEPIAENVAEKDAAVALVGSIARYRVDTQWSKED